MARKAGSSGEETAQAARAAALKLFARSGYAAVSMRQLAAETGVQPGALYNYWATKQDLLVDLLTRHMSMLHEAADAALPSREETAADPVAALNRFVRFHIRFHIDRADEIFISYMELRALEPEHFARIEVSRRAYEERLRAILTAGVEAGLFAIPDVKVAAMALIAMLTGVNTWYRSGGRLSPRHIEDIYAEMAARSVGLSDASAALTGAEKRPHTRGETPARRRVTGGR